MIKTANLTGPVSRNAGGLYESVRRLVLTLEANDMEVCVFGTQDEHTAADLGAWAPVEVRAFRTLWPKAIGYSPEFLPALEKFAPDITHTHGIWLYSSVATNHYFRKRSVPYVISAHGMVDPWAIRNSRWKKAIAYFFYEEAHLREAACLRALCESEAQSIRKLGFKNPIAVIPNGIDVPSENELFTAKAAHAPWNKLVQPGQKVLLFLSRIHPKKGLMNLLRAWAALNRKSDDWVLAIAGWDQGGHEAELKRLATELGIAWSDVRDKKSEIGKQKAGILFLGPQFNEGKAACYCHCDAFVLPSFSEGVPMVVLEAWAYGKPVLMTPECNLSIGFARGAAVCIQPEAKSIAGGLSQLFEMSSVERGALGQNGLQLVREKFVWPVIGKQMTDLYIWLLGRGSKPTCMHG